MASKPSFLPFPACCSYDYSGWMLGEDAELEDELWSAAVPDSQCHHRNGRKRTRKQSTKLPPASPAHPASPTQSSKAEFPTLSPSASVRAGPDASTPRVSARVGPDTSPHHRASLMTEPDAFQPQPSPCSPREEPEAPWRILQGDRHSGPCSSLKWTKGGQPRGHCDQLFPESADSSLQDHQSSTDKSASDLIILNNTPKSVLICCTRPRLSDHYLLPS